MFSVRFKAPVKGLLATVLVASLGGFGAIQAAETGAGATGGSAPPPLTINSAPSSPAPAGLKTPPATSVPAPTVPKLTPTTTTSAPVADIPGNPDGSCPATAPVKVSKSKIYHVPEETNYKNTKAKHCFASAQAAEQAGYRAPKK